ncbi:MAG: T9SS type A sorting domain-containing protein [Bacteroidota bacterium]
MKKIFTTLLLASTLLTAHAQLVISGCTGFAAAANGTYQLSGISPTVSGSSTLVCECYDREGVPGAFFATDAFGNIPGWYEGLGEFGPAGCSSFDAFFNTPIIEDPDCDINTNSTIVGPGCIITLDGVPLGGALPVELTEFKVSVVRASSQLVWQTATEINNEGFEIQRSMDGQAWQKIGFVRGQGSTQEPQQYTFTDELPLNGTNYYRLKQMDFDGQVDYSAIEVVEIATDHTPLSLYPSPARQELNIINGKGQATIYNLLGQSVRQLVIDSEQFRIPTTDLVDGQYILQVLRVDGTVVAKQFVK